MEVQRDKNSKIQSLQVFEKGSLIGFIPFFTGQIIESNLKCLKTTIVLKIE